MRPIRCAAIALITSAVAVTIGAQSAATESTPAFKLDSVSSIEIGIPNFLRKDSAQCDAVGNAYFAAATGDYKTKYILRIPANGQNVKPFLLPTDLGTTGDWKFYVGSTGTLYALHSEPTDSEKGNDNHTIVELSSSGEEIRRIRLQLPKDFDLVAFAVLPDGRSMVQGFVVLPVDMSKYKDESSVKADFYTAWLDTDGRLVHDLGTNAKDRKEFSLTGPNDAALVEGRPGTFLSLTGTTLTTYDNSGLLVHAQTIPKPSKQAYALGLQYVDGQAVVNFLQMDTGKPDPVEEPTPAPMAAVKPDPNARRIVTAVAADNVWLIADPESGALHGFYKPNTHFVGSGVCYLGSQNFLYFTVKNGRPMLVQQHAQ